MIIRDTWGYKLNLSTTRLTEHESDGWYLKLAEFPKLTAKEYQPYGVLIYAKGDAKATMLVAVGTSAWSKKTKIGCHYFSRKTYRLIQKAARKARKVVQLNPRLPQGSPQFVNRTRTTRRSN